MNFRVLGIFILSLALSGCFQTENSSAQDAAFADDPNSTPEFRAARLILSQECASCHDYHTKSEAQLIEDGDIIAGDPDNSPIYFRLQGASSPNDPGEKDMPQNDSISLNDVAKIKVWIEGVQP